MSKVAGAKREPRLPAQAPLCSKWRCWPAERFLHDAQLAEHDDGTQPSMAPLLKKAMGASPCAMPGSAKVCHGKSTMAAQAVQLVAKELTVEKAPVELGGTSPVFPSLMS